MIFSRQENGDDPEHVFEIEDFTTVSDWEVFIARVEEAYQNWGICGPRPSLGNGEWKEDSVLIEYSG